MTYLDLDMHRALADAGYAPLDEYVQRQRERRRPAYFNVYNNGLVGVPHDTRREAESIARSNRHSKACGRCVLRLVVRPK